MKRFNVVCGETFDVEAFDVQDIQDVKELSRIAHERRNERFRSRLAIVVACSVAVALILAVAIGLYQGSMAPVGHVWSAAAMPLGYILRAYFDVRTPP